MSTGAAEETAGGAGAVAVAVGSTFVTYMTADFLSNFIQHPTQKVSSRKYIQSSYVVVPFCLLNLHLIATFQIDRWITDILTSF